MCQDVEAFLYREARLIDQWRLEEWVGLFDSEGEYLVAPLDSKLEEDNDYDFEDALFLIADDLPLIKGRVARLLNIRAHAEHPRSKVRHFITNIDVTASSNSELTVDSNLIVTRWRRHHLDLYTGHCRHRIRPPEGSGPLKDMCILERRIILDMDVLDPVGPISFIL